jgi:broad specificity phosphatase PhoE
LVAAAIVLSVRGATAQAAPEGATTVFLVRHAEKGTDGADPALTEAGVKRAQALADVLADAGITAIFSSEFNRTKQTAAPLAERLGLTVTVVPAKDLDGLIAKARELRPGGRALIVGHSNTVPAAAARLSGVKAAEMGETDYDRLYVATFRGSGPGELVVLHYGGR